MRKVEKGWDLDREYVNLGRLKTPGLVGLSGVSAYCTLRKCLFLGVLQAANACPRKRKHASSSHSLPRSLSYSPAPCIDPWQADRGRLIAALRICGAVFLRILPDEFEKVLPDFSAWHTLWKEALEDFRAFCSRSAVRSRQLRFSKGEDLLRTRVGESKAHTPDVRYNFGLGQDALRSKASLWGGLFAESRLSWILAVDNISGRIGWRP